MKPKKQTASITVLFSLLIVIAFGFWQKQTIFDWIRLRDYIPSSEIAQLATATTMTDDGKQLFYVNWPTLQGRAEFNQSCSDSEQSIVLGCFISPAGIYLYDVKDERLNGVEEVTAAHEMLHAAYERLSSKDRERIDKLTAQELRNVKDDRIIATVKSYHDKDPSVVPNELHSIIATEVADISPELEEYYSRYFKDRSIVVKLSQQYEKAFSELESKAEQNKQQLEKLKIQIDSKNKQLETEALALSVEFKDLESRRHNANPTSFNIQVVSYNNRVNAYNAEVQVVSSMIDQYNNILAEYNKIVTQENELINAIDSRPKTINTE